MSSKKKIPSGKSKRAPAQADKARKAAIAEIEARLDQLPDVPTQDATDANVGEPVASDATTPSPAPSTKGGKNKAPKQPKPERQKRVSALATAAIVLAESGTSMSAKSMVETAAAKGLWQTRSGKTPEASVYAAIIREIAAKGSEARFVKVDRGLFAARKQG